MNDGAFIGYKNLFYKTSISARGKQYFRILSVDENGIEIYSEIKSIVVHGGIEHQVFPVPAKNHLNFTNSHQIKSVEIVDQLGRRQKITNSSFDQGIDFSGYGNGVYFIRIVNENGSIFQQTLIK